MTFSLSHLLIRVLVFGAALFVVARTDKDVVFKPRFMLPVVAGVFAIMNALLYTLFATVFNVVTLFALFFVVPFVVNGGLLLATDRLIKQFKIESITALIKLAGVVTIAHLGLRLLSI